MLHIALVCFVGYCIIDMFLVPEKYQVHIQTAKDFMELIFSFYFFVTSVCDLTIIMSCDSQNIVWGNLKLCIASTYLLTSIYMAQHVRNRKLLETRKPTHFVDNSENPERIYINDRVIYKNIIYVVSEPEGKMKLRPEDNQIGIIKYGPTLKEALLDKDNPLVKFKE